MHKNLGENMTQSLDFEQALEDLKSGKASSPDEA